MPDTHELRHHVMKKVKGGPLYVFCRACFAQPSELCSDGLDPRDDFHRTRIADAKEAFGSTNGGEICE